MVYDLVTPRVLACFDIDPLQLQVCIVVVKCVMADVSSSFFGEAMLFCNGTFSRVKNLLVLGGFVYKDV